MTRASPPGCRHHSSTARCCLICQVLRRRREARQLRGLPRGTRSTIARRLVLVRQALDAELEVGT